MDNNSLYKLEDTPGGIVTNVEKKKRESKGEKPEIEIEKESQVGLKKVEIIGEAYRELQDIVKRYARVNLPVLFYGETGTGKELFMDLYKESTPRTGYKGIINCAAYADDLLQSEVFGHVKGAFTGAVTDRKGKIAACEKGVLALDEIGDATPQFQAAILRVTDGYSYSPVGSDKEIKPDIVIVAATNRPEKLRADLRERFHLLPIPPLQKEDIPALARHFLGELVSASVIRELQLKNYKGNIRGLKKACERLKAERGDALFDKRKQTAEVSYRIDRRKLEELAMEKLDPAPAPQYMSVDEVAWQKWHKYVTNVVDIDQRKVIWNHQGRGKVNLDKFFRSLGTENCEQIQAVASDGARGYLSSIKEYAKNALIVLDHFHVKKYLNDALDSVRKEELKRARQQNNGDLAAMLHCNKRFILMQNKVTSKKQDLLQRLAGLNERIYQAMLLKEQFLSIYTDPQTARRNLHGWIVASINSKIPAFVELGYKFFRKRHYLLNYFVCKITTAISEGINNKIKRLSRMAYGYRDVHYFLLKIHQHCGLLNPRFAT